MTDYLFDFRATLAGPASFAGDPGGVIPIYPALPVYQSVALGGTGYGYLSSPPAGNDLSSSIDVRLAGTNSNTSRSTKFRIDMANGNYKLRLATGQNGVTVRHQFAVWDGGLRDAGTSVNIATWTASAAIAAGSYCVLPDVNGVFCLLKTAAGGTNAATFVPGSGAGPFTDGNGVTWTLIKRAVISADSIGANPGGNPNGSVMDATGVSQTFANWPTLHALSPSFAVTQGFVEVTRGNDGVNYPRHYAFLAQATALQDLTYQDAWGVTSAAPPIYAGQPAGTVMFYPIAATGAAAPGNFSLSGALAQYLDLATVNGKTAVVSKAGNPIPDSVAAAGAGSRALVVTQTDPSGSITGSPHASPSLTLPVTSSQGKPTDNSDDGLMRTESYLIVQQILAMKAAEWNPAPASYVDVGTALNAAQVVSLYNSITPNGTSCYRIKVGGPGNWATFAQIALTPKDFFNGGPPINTAGLVIEAASGFTDQLNCKFTYDGARGVKISSSLTLIAPKANDDPNGGGSYLNLHTGKIPSTSIYNVVRIECDNGRAFIPGYDSANEALYVSPVNGTKSRQPNSIVFYHAEQLIAVCRNWGVADAEIINGCRYARMANDNRDLLGDAGAQSNFYYLATPQGIWADNNTWLLRETTHQTPYDHWDQFSPSHPDLNQSRAPESAWNDISGTHVIAIGDQCITEDGKIYTAASGGTKGTVRPSHTAGTVSDGSINWTFTKYIAGSVGALGRQIVVNMGNHAACGGTTVDGSNVGPEVQLFLDSSRGCYPTDIVCVNVIVATASQYGIGNASTTFPVTNPGNTYVEKCGMFGPPFLNIAQDVNEKTVSGGLGRVICRNSILGGSSPTITGAAVIAENNVSVDWVGGVSPNRAQDVVIGTFGSIAANQGNRATFALTDNLTVTPAQMRAALEAQLLTSTRLVGARTKSADYAPSLIETLAGKVNSPRSNGVSIRTRAHL